MSWPVPITLEGQYATLVPLSLEHCSALTEAVKDGELWKLWYTNIPVAEEMLNEIQINSEWPVVKANLRWKLESRE